MNTTRRIPATFDAPVSRTVYVGTTRAAVEVLDAATCELQTSITAIADERARMIAELAGETSVRQAADELGLSPAAVSKAVARAAGAPAPERLLTVVPE